jgi:hypothetical protein
MSIRKTKRHKNTIGDIEKETVKKGTEERAKKTCVEHMLDDDMTRLEMDRCRQYAIWYLMVHVRLGCLDRLRYLDINLINLICGS